MIGVVRKVVFKDKNGEEISFPSVDEEKCYLYVECLEDNQSQMAVLEDVYFSVGSVLKLKYVHGAWHLLEELNKRNPIDICSCPEDYFFINAKAGRGLNDAAKKVYGSSSYFGKVTGKYLKEQQVINHKFGGSKDFKKIYDVEEQFDVISNSQNIDYGQIEFIELIAGTDKYLAGNYDRMIRNFWFLLYHIIDDIEKKRGGMNLEKWIQYVAFVLDLANSLHFLYLTNCSGKIYNDYNSGVKKNLLKAIVELLQIKVISDNMPIYEQLKEELNVKKDVYERKLKKRDN